VAPSRQNVAMSSNCGACGIELHKTTERIKCAGKCERSYHPICTNIRTQQDIEIFVTGKTQWFCNFCRYNVCDRIIDNVNNSSRSSQKIEDTISDRVRIIIDEILALRIQVEEILNKLNDLEIAVYDIKAVQWKCTRKTMKCQQRNDKKYNEYADHLNLNKPGRKEREGNCNSGESTVQLSCEGYLTIIRETVAKSLKVRVYLLAAITLIFVACTISGL
jgi:hypothetical protein